MKRQGRGGVSDHLVNRCREGDLLTLAEPAGEFVLPDPVPESVRQERWERFMQHQQRISASRLARYVGRTVDVVIDQIEGKVAIGRSAADAPGIDGVVRIKGGSKVQPGSLQRVLIDASDDYDLTGRLAAKPGAAS